MATVKVDISEWEAMKDKERILKDNIALLEEKNKEIQQLKEEKIKALEDAKMKVVKVDKREITEYKLLVRDPTHETYAALKYLFQNYERLGYTNVNQETYNTIISKLFKTVTSTSINDKSITTHGLDDIKAELTKEIEADVDLVYKAYEKDYKNLSKVVDKYKEDLKLQTDVNKELISVNTKLEETIAKKKDISKKYNVALNKVRIYSEFISNLKTLIINTNIILMRKAINKAINELNINIENLIKENGK